MIYITQLIYIVPGQEDIFDAFEAIAIPTISKCNGKLLFRVRPGETAYVESHMERPYEIHLVTFDTEDDFERFKKDKERQQFLHLKEQSVRETIMIQGSRI